jgi:hypothetical protein
MRILYVGNLAPRESSLYRCNALRRLGHEVEGLDTAWCESTGGRLLSAIRVRALGGPAIARLNEEILAVSRRFQPQLVWFDKPIFVRKKTVDALRESGALTVQFCIDNPFGPRGDPGWRLFRQTLPHYQVHLVQRDSNLGDYRDAGAKDVRIFRTAYEPTMHFPPPPGWSDADRPEEVVFIGAPYDDRPAFLAALAERHNVPVKIWGAPEWGRVAPSLYQGSALLGDDYREGLWRAKICLSFVTHSNCDDVAHKSFEIAACGAFLLAEESPGHRAHFTADAEAVFFHDVESCAAAIRRYLADESARSRIAAAGCRRARDSGYGNDARIAAILGQLRADYPRLA